MEEKQVKIHISDRILEKYLDSTNYEEYILKDIIYQKLSIEIDEILTNNIDELFSCINKFSAHDFFKKFGYKLKSPKCKKAEVDFKIRNLIYSILKRKKFKEQSKNKIILLFASTLIKNREEEISLEKTIREIIIEELFYRIKKSNYVLRNNYLEIQEFSRVKQLVLNMQKYIKANLKSNILKFIIDLVIAFIIDRITKCKNKLEESYNRLFSAFGGYLYLSGEYF